VVRRKTTLSLRSSAATNTRTKPHNPPDCPGRFSPPRPA